MEYPYIAGAPCKNCAPEGWIETNLFLIYAHIIVPVNGPLPETSCTLGDISGTSPAGGNAVVLFGASDHDYLTTIQTTLTGLDTDTYYTFGIWWEEVTANCAINTYVEGGILQITIDGELYEFSGAINWELAEVCFQPTSSTAEVIISTIPSVGTDAAIMVDGPIDCSLASLCCTISTDIEDDEFSLCPGETAQFEASYMEPNGPVVVEWTCDNPEGLNYLNATNVIDPIFSFPSTSTDFDGAQYTFSVTIQDDACAKVIENITVDVSPWIIPGFDETEFCEFDIFAELPEESNNGYSGIWEGDFLIEDQGGNTVTYTFDINSEQNNCLESYSYDFYVENGTFPTFEIDSVYCSSDSTNYELPLFSQEMNPGEWFPSATVNPAELGEGSYQYTFTPYDYLEENFCVGIFEIGIHILSYNVPTFDLPQTFCLASDEYTLPTISTNGIDGTWSVNSIDLSSPVENITIEFTPNAVDGCTAGYTFTYSVIESAEPAFSIVSMYCSNDSSFELPETSSNGISGVWDQNPVDPSAQDSLVVTFTPDDNCSNAYAQTLYFTEYVEPSFDLPELVCADGGVIDFPSMSTNGISGTWNESTIDPSTVDISIIENTFTPDDLMCTSIITIEMEILTFDDVSLATTNPSGCETEDGAIEIMGTSENMEMSVDDGENWTSVMNIENLASGSYTIQIRYSNLTSCTVVFSPQLNSAAAPNISDIIPTDPSACDEADGMIECVVEGDNLEYSLDEVNWQTSNVFEDLADGDYVVYVRPSDQIDCVSSGVISLSNPTSEEVCDGVDNDCDGEIDEGLTTQDYYADTDMDGFGDPDDVITSCSQPDGYVLNNSDCDDTDDGVNMDAEEVCDGIDNNCDGQVDEELTFQEYYADADQDGFGDPDNALSDCALPAGYVSDSSDCDDTNPDIYPGAEEIPNNGIDEDCDGMDLITSINEIGGQQVEVYPNPTNGVVNIRVEDNRDVLISLYDMQGQCLIKNSSTKRVDISDYANGVYLLKITGQKTEEFIIKRVVLY